MFNLATHCSTGSCCVYGLSSSFDLNSLCFVPPDYTLLLLDTDLRLQTLRYKQNCLPQLVGSFIGHRRVLQCQDDHKFTSRRGKRERGFCLEPQAR